MEHSPSVHDGVGIVVCRGVFTVKGFTDALKAVLAHQDFQAGMPCLWDCREATVGDLGSSDIRDIGATMEESASHRGHGKTAVVTGSDVMFGMARMYDLATESKRPNPFQVFRDIEQARAWLAAALST